MGRSGVAIVGVQVLLLMAINVLALPSPSPMWQIKHDGKAGLHEPLLGGSHQDAASRHQDVMNRGLAIFREAAGHKLDAIETALEMHRQGKGVHRQMNERLLTPTHASQHRAFKLAAARLGDLQPSIERMHTEMQRHVESLRKGGSQKAQETAAAAELRESLTVAKAWNKDHGEDEIGVIGQVRNKQNGLQHFANYRTTRELVDALQGAKKEVLGELKKHPKAKVPAQSFLDNAKEKLSNVLWGSNSPQHR